MGLPPETQKKWDRLAKKVQAVREEHKEEQEERMGNESQESSEDVKKNARAGSVFLSSVISGGLVGYGIDWLFNTLPWGMLIFLVMGFVNAVLRANATMKDD